MSLLDIKNLSVAFGSVDKPFRAVESVDFSINRGEIVGIVGESGSGKSVTMLAVVGESGCGKSTLARQLTLI
ncbi:MAG: ATP-binding cassette domain-containing protein, partial [Burkholderiales bacterium]|nr:ATP-binding cassette domain-containing protein [Burkholderiales bacterium]